MTWPMLMRPIPTALALAMAASSCLAQQTQPQLQPQPQPQLQPQPQAPARPTTVEAAVLQALAINPVTAPYRFSATMRNGKLVLGGRVGTKQIHDAAIQVASLGTNALDDRIVIDTAAAHQAAGVPLATLPNPGWAVPYSGAGYGGYGGAPYVYPQPLFGYYDDPFYGFSPPAISYPPYWGGLSAMRRRELNMAPAAGPPQMGPPPAASPTSAAADASSGAGPVVEMTLDPRGVGVLRGTVASDADRVAIGQKAANLQGVTQVVNLLEVRPDATAPAAPPAEAVPPPPPRPADEPPAPALQPGRAAPAPRADTAPPDANAPLDRRIAQSLARRPALAGIDVHSSARDGFVTLSGKVPSAYEAMIAYRAAQQTAGVREIDDRLEFTVPDEPGRNPLLNKGRPEDVEPYLEAQIRRQLGDAAHLDRVRLSGDRLEIKGTVPTVADKPRIEAVFRSMPLLRGFKVEPDLQPE